MPNTHNIRLCTAEGCKSRHHARGFCQRHYCKTPEKKASNRAYRKRNPIKLQEWKRKQDKRYRERYPEKIKALSQRRRGRRVTSRGNFGWIDVRLVSNYYTKICGICGLKINSQYELDHIIPLSRNGDHQLDNLQLTHPICNRTKHNKLQKDMELDILILRELIND